MVGFSKLNIRTIMTRMGLMMSPTVTQQLATIQANQTQIIMPTLNIILSVTETALANQAKTLTSLNTIIQQGVKILALEDDLEAAAGQEIAALKTIHDELVAALASPTVDRTRVQAVVDKLNASFADNPDPGARSSPGP